MQGKSSHSTYQYQRCTYELLGDLCALDKPNTKTFEELVQKLREHFQPTPPVISEHYKFHLRSQQTEETAIKYIAALRQLDKNCASGIFLNEPFTRQVCVWSR